MIHQVHAIYDTKAQVYTLPFFMQNQQTAERTFMDWVNDPEHTFGKHPEDYTLFKIGEYDDNLATFTQDKIEAIGTGLNYLLEDKS